MKKELQKIIAVGACVRFQYPRHNFHGVAGKSESRRLRIMRIRDTSKDPIEKKWVEMNPTLLRGRYLVTGEDLDKSEERSFYLERMTELDVIPAHECDPSRFIVLDGSRKSHGSEVLMECIRVAVAAQRGQVYGKLADIS